GDTGMSPYIDECQGLSPADCGPHANCTNVPGSYYCNIDECRQNATICEPHGNCINMPGSYMCKCSWGFGKSQKDPSQICTGTTGAGNSLTSLHHGAPTSPVYPPLPGSCHAVCYPFPDIEECRKTPDICGPKVMCINTYGSYWCECRAGYIPSNRNTTLCEGGSCCWGHGGGTWGAGQGLGLHRYVVIPCAGVCIAMGTARALGAAAQHPLAQGWGVYSNGHGQGIGGSTPAAQHPWHQSAPGPLLPPFHPSPLSLAGFTLAGLLTYQGMSPLLDGAGRVEAPEWDEIGQTGKRAQEPGRPSYRVLSPVVSAFISDPNPQALGLSISIRFSHPVPTDLRLLCAYWEPDSRRWASHGCTLQKLNATITHCQCNHLTIFAVLMAFYDDPLTIIRYVGLTLSLLCLLLAILTFLLCCSIRNVSTSLHLQLCLCLFLADLLFLTPVTRTGSKVACAVIAGLVHYLFLACFSWMLLEGLHLFLTVRNLKVVNYTSASWFKKRFMYPFGYGFPALVVAISAAVNPDGYGTSTRYVQKYFPLFPQINITFFALTLWILRKTLSSLNADMSTLRDHRLLTFKAIAQFFILGFTWIPGLFQVSPAATVMAYLFTVNSLQGPFIFLVHCLLNRQVREEYRRWIKRFRTFSTKSQTSDLSMSAVPTTSTKTVRGPLLCSNTSL
uniref:Adhesion G protein-coupled receptor E2 n=1 Tax=Chrysemys picta bellii TaxID=8478 RepID=A0A8C3HTA2_CHRPI